MIHQVDEAKFRQQVGDDLAERLLGLIQVHVEISQHDGVLIYRASNMNGYGWGGGIKEGGKNNP